MTDVYGGQIVALLAEIRDSLRKPADGWDEKRIHEYCDYQLAKAKAREAVAAHGLSGTEGHFAPEYTPSNPADPFAGEPQRWTDHPINVTVTGGEIADRDRKLFEKGWDAGEAAMRDRIVKALIEKWAEPTGLATALGIAQATE